jgi:hypothetical protein
VCGHGELQDGVHPQYCSSCVSHSVFEYFQSELKGAVDDLTKQLEDIPWGVFNSRCVPGVELKGRWVL